MIFFAKFNFLSSIVDKVSYSTSLVVTSEKSTFEMTNMQDLEIYYSLNI